jgi:hypothetical protein
MKIVPVVCILIFLAGCAETVTVWRKPGGTQDEERAIMDKCVYEAESNSQEGTTSDSSRQLRVIKLRDMCLKANGMVIVSRDTHISTGQDSAPK